jgi:hypothetical protein
LKVHINLVNMIAQYGLYQRGANVVPSYDSNAGSSGWVVEDGRLFRVPLGREFFPSPRLPGRSLTISLRYADIKNQLLSIPTTVPDVSERRFWMRLRILVQ